VIALHVGTNANSMGLQTHSSNGLAPWWVAEKLQSHSQEKHEGFCGKVLYAEGLFFTP
jgi:hypothetical protein